MSAITLKNIPKGLHLEDALGIKNQRTNNVLEEAKNMRAMFKFSITDKDIENFKSAGRKS